MILKAISLNLNTKLEASDIYLPLTASDTAYLTSAGATDCMSTDASGNTSAGTASSSTSGNGRNTHFTNMNNIALK